MTARRDLLALFGQSAGDMLDGWFESDPIKAVLGFDAIVGNYASPYAPGTAYVLLHHLLRRDERPEGRVGTCHRRHGRDHAGDGEGVRGKRRRHPRRTMPSREVIVEKGRAVGVATEKGESFRARAVVSNLNPKLLFTRLVAQDLLPADFRERMCTLSLRLGHVPHECRAVGIAEISPACRNPAII